MAQYKVPQDVEAEDKLLGPFTFRQFIYLLIAAALAAVAFLLFKIFPFLVIIPVPFIIFMLVLALPLKKDQPMETYLAAVVSFYTKPHKRVWEPGEPESTVVITAPKKVEEKRTKDFGEDEASRRLSFLAEIVDTEGYAIKNGSNSQLSDEIQAEASTVEDIFETSYSYSTGQNLQSAADARHDQLVAQMRNAIDNSRTLSSSSATIGKFSTASAQPTQQTQAIQQPAQTFPQPTQQFTQPTPISQPIAQQPTQTTPQFTQATTPAVNLPTPGQFVAQPMQQSAPQPIQQTTPQATPDFTQQITSPNISSIPQPQFTPQAPSLPVNPIAQSYETEEDNPFIVKPDEEVSPAQEQPEPTPEPEPKEPTQDIIDLANNNDFSIETIAKQANRINKKNDDGEVYISLH